MTIDRAGGCVGSPAYQTPRDLSPRPAPTRRSRGFLLGAHPMTSPTRRAMIIRQAKLARTAAGFLADAAAVASKEADREDKHTDDQRAALAHYADEADAIDDAINALVVAAEGLAEPDDDKTPNTHTEPKQ